MSGKFSIAVVAESGRHNAASGRFQFVREGVTEYVPAGYDQDANSISPLRATKRQSAGKVIRILPALLSLAVEKKCVWLDLHPRNRLPAVLVNSHPVLATGCWIVHKLVEFLLGLTELFRVWRISIVRNWPCQPAFGSCDDFFDLDLASLLLGLDTSCISCP